MSEESKPLFENTPSAPGTVDCTKEVVATIEKLNGLLYRASQTGILVTLEVTKRRPLGYLPYNNIKCQTFLKIISI